MSRTPRKPSPEDGEIRELDPSTLDPEFARELRAWVGSPEYHREKAASAEKAARLVEQHRDAPLRFGFAEGPLPGGADAVIVRMKEGVAKRLIVFTAASVTDLAIAVSLHALREDEEETPDRPKLRMLRVWADQRVEGPGVSKQMRYQIPAGTRGDAALLLRDTVVGEVDVPTLGSVRIVEDQP